MRILPNPDEEPDTGNPLILTVEHLLGGEECHPLMERTVGSLGPSDVEHRMVPSTAPPCHEQVPGGAP
ncbi:hypothetical protein [Corallococcus exercitus]|uniref:hypothetical protein n=1 Tax=Corallococcus exercitus TaxID=2316736 RepID=UPI0035D40F04